MLLRRVQLASFCEAETIWLRFAKPPNITGFDFQSLLGPPGFQPRYLGHLHVDVESALKGDALSHCKRLKYLKFQSLNRLSQKSLVQLQYPTC